MNLHWKSRFFHFNLLPYYNLNVVIPPTVLNFLLYDNFVFMIVYDNSVRTMKGFSRLDTCTIYDYLYMVKNAPSYIWTVPLTSRSADSLWNAVRDGNSRGCLQSWTVCSALLLPCCMTRSLHPFISLCLSFLICNIGIIIYVIYLMYRSTDIKPFKSTTKGWGGTIVIICTMLPVNQQW